MEYSPPLSGEGPGRDHPSKPKKKQASRKSAYSKKKADSKAVKEDAAKGIKKGINWDRDCFKTVHGEVYRPATNKEPTPPVKVTDPAKLEMLIARAQKTTFIAGVDEKRRIEALKRFEPQEFEQDEIVFKQGDDADVGYIVESGEYTSTGKTAKVFDENTPSIGEIALLFKGARDSTVKCTKAGTLWKLARRPYTILLVNMAYERRVRYMKLLNRVELFDSVQPHEKVRVSDAMKIMNVKKGEKIYAEGDNADRAYWVEQGQVTVRFNNGRTKVRKRGNSFGEWALLLNTKREDSATADQDSELVYLEATAFETCMGKLKNMLYRDKAKFKSLCKEKLGDSEPDSEVFR